MPQLVALSLSIAVLGGIWAWLTFVPLAGYALVWAGFIAWGCFFHTGGDSKAFVKTLIGTCYGVVIAWIALLLIFTANLAASGWVVVAVVVAVTVFFLVIVAKIEPLSAVPANVYGYAAAVAYSLHEKGMPGPTPDVRGTGPLENLTAANFHNPLVLLIVSLALGTIFGWLSGQLAAALTRKA